MVRILSTLLLAICTLTTHAVTVSISVNSNAYCVYATGSLCAEANGGVGPYTYLWSTGSTSTCIHELTAGTYSVTVTDGLGAIATDEVTLQSQPMPGTSAIWLPRCPIEWYGVWPQYKLFAFASTSTIGVEPFTAGSLPAYYLPMQDWNAGFLMIAEDGPPGTPMNLTITDGNGCTSTMETVVPQPPQYLQPQVLDVEGSCSGGANGRVRVFVPAEPNGWSSAFKLFGPNGYLAWTSSSTYAGPNGYSAGDGPREFIQQNLSPGTYHLVQHTNWDLYGVPNLEEQWFDMNADECPDTLVTFEVPDLGFTCGTLSGKAYVDVNVNCVQNGAEPNLPSTVIEVQPGDHYTLTDGLGRYIINLPMGTYTVADQNPLYQEHCGVEGTPFTISSGTPNVTRNLADTSLSGLDVRLSISSGPARPGFEVHYAVSVRNLTGVNGGNGTVSYTYDPALIYLGSNLAPASIVGNTITWNVSNLGAFGDRSFRPRFQVPPDINLLGMDLVSSGTLSMLNNEDNTDNNTAEHVVTITGAYDPNDKLARTSMGNTSTWQIADDEWIDYTIRFQNTGTDTAFFVVITDTLPPNLDPASFVAGASSHTHTVNMRGNGILRWMFPNILLPDSNVNEPLSHGFVSFRIRPHEGLAVGQQITNIANIYFDYNPPVITEPSVLDVVSPLRVDARAWLGGAFDDQSGLMHDSLRTLGLLPLVEPYTGLGYAHSGGGGGETITPAVLSITGPSAVVDWVVLELRDASQPSMVLHSRSALLLRDGRITDKDGVSPVRFTAPVGSYHLALRHRNHLGVMSAAPVSLGPVATTWDLRATSTPLHGVSPTQVEDARRELWPGDVDQNGIVRYTGQMNDRDPLLLAIGGVLPTAVVNGVYGPLDVNMDGRIKYIGANNDRDIILQTIGGSVPTATRLQQLP